MKRKQPANPQPDGSLNFKLGFLPQILKYVTKRAPRLLGHNARSVYPLIARCKKISHRNTRQGSPACRYHPDGPQASHPHEQRPHDLLVLTQPLYYRETRRKKASGYSHTRFFKFWVVLVTANYAATATFLTSRLTRRACRDNFSSRTFSK